MDCRLHTSSLATSARALLFMTAQYRAAGKWKLSLMLPSIPNKRARLPANRERMLWRGGARQSAPFGCPPHQSMQVDRELQNEGNKGWMPSERRKWLLFEPDNDPCSREEQAHVATQMIICQNRLLQLIVRDGKTAVIAPLIILSLIHI